jgi:hypothetical protein
MYHEELIGLLLRSREPIDISQYGRDGWSSLEDALTDIKQNDVRPSFNEFQGCVDFYRHRVKGICTSEGYRLLEVERWYPKQERMLGFKIGCIHWKGFSGWRKIKEVQEFSISETIKLIGEVALKALIRGVREEWKLKLPEELFSRELFLNSPSGRRMSRAYPGVWSIGWEEWISFKLPRRPCKWNPIFDDNGVLLFLEWFPLNHESRYRYLERKVLSFCIRTIVTIYFSF